MTFNIESVRATMQTARSIRHYLQDTLGAQDVARYPELYPSIEALYFVNDSPNPYYSRSQEGFLLFEEYYGMPSKIWTPCGSWRCDRGSGTIDESWRKEVWERLGLIPLYFHGEPTAENIRGVYIDSPMCGGMYGPVYAITRDLDGNELPAATATNASSVGLMPGFFTPFPEGKSYADYKELWRTTEPADWRRNVRGEADV